MSIEKGLSTGCTPAECYVPKRMRKDSDSYPDNPDNPDNPGSDNYTLPLPKTPFRVFRVLRVIRDSDKNGDNYFTHPSA